MGNFFKNHGLGNWHGALKQLEIFIKCRIWLVFHVQNELQHLIKPPDALISFNILLTVCWFITFISQRLIFMNTKSRILRNQIREPTVCTLKQKDLSLFARETNQPLIPSCLLWKIMQSPTTNVWENPSIVILFVKLHIKVLLLSSRVESK
jgi:hypothetical protein